jgi:hypothetical protein
MTDPAAVLVDADEIDELRRLLGTVEDWLLHAADETLDDLGRFLAGLAWSVAPAERLTTALITDLGDHSVTLARALRSAANRAGKPS